jgi:hypothetical protein
MQIDIDLFVCLFSELIYVAILLQVWKRFAQFEQIYGDLSSMLKV